ncbi:MAG: azurin [Verrucomicrobiales bacterium]|jgi:azurin
MPTRRSLFIASALLCVVAPAFAQEPLLELESFGIYEKSAPTPEKVTRVQTQLPLTFSKQPRIAFVGNTLLDRAQNFAWLESMLQQAFPDFELAIRNFAWSADEVDLQPRPDNFATVSQHLTREKIDIIFAAFGYNESFAGIDAIPEFKSRLQQWAAETASSAFNGKAGPHIVLLSPTANEDIAGTPAATLNNDRLKAYTDAMRDVANSAQIGFVDLFTPTLALIAEPASELTINGVHLNSDGYYQVAKIAFSAATGIEPPAVREDIRTLLVDKNRQYFRRYRPLNTFYYTGGRNGKYGYLDFLPAMRNFEIMTDNRERQAWAMARGEASGTQTIDDSNVPPLEAVAESRGANEWLTPADELKAFRVDPRFEVNLFASEEKFPDIACPIQMRWDARGRLWVACSTTYPHIYPGNEPNDKIVILEDTDWDGVADKSIVWADDLHIPLSFELYGDGIFVSEEPHLSWIRDTDGDGKADFRQQILTGFGTEDSHHALHDIVWTPDGDLLFRESIFHNSQVETAYGPVRAKNSSWFQFHPATRRLTAFGAYPNTNPWGVTFDDWGNHVASHPVFASAFHATNPPYPKQHPKADGLPAYSGVCGHEFVDFPMWPDDLKGGFIKVRYKPTNRVEIHQWVEHDDHFEEKYVSDLIFSENLSFIPVDLRYGPKGAMYVCDWYNPVKGHAQYALRDPRRDRSSGRIWRIIPKGATLQDPPKIAGSPIATLLDHLKRPEYRYRYWTKRELRQRDNKEVATALDAWLTALPASDPRLTHHQLEALWVFRMVGADRPYLLASLLKSPNAHARAAATRQLRHWHALFADDGIAHLATSASDANGMVRMEAAIAASYIDTPQALAAILPMLENDSMGDHLRYAVVCALGSEKLSQHWQKNADSNELVTAFLAKSKKPNPRKAANKARRPANANEADFDSQKDLANIEVSCIPERLLYTVTEFKVKPGQPVKLVFSNPDITAHNLLIVKPGAQEEIGIAGNEMAKDPSGLQKGFIPKSKKILHHTRLLNQNEAQTLRFKAPLKPGIYPYLCTFPGHWVIMKGEMHVSEK